MPSKMGINFYSKLGIRQTWWHWKEDSDIICLCGALFRRTRCLTNDFGGETSLKIWRNDFKERLHGMSWAPQPVREDALPGKASPKWGQLFTLGSKLGKLGGIGKRIQRPIIMIGYMSPKSFYADIYDRLKWTKPQSLSSLFQEPIQGSCGAPQTI